MSMWILLGYLFVGCLAKASMATTCTRSHECPADQCCRDSSGSTLVDTEGRWGHWELHQTQGQCVEGGAAPGELCDSTCKCPSGYECYREMSGVCCPPRKCITKAEADAHRAYWWCRPPPRAAPPASQQLRQQRSLFSSLCPALPP